MTKYLQKQLKQQRQMLHLELPSLYCSKTMLKLRQNNRKNNYISDDDDDNDDYDKEDSLGNASMFEMGAVPTPASETAQVAVKIFANKKFD